MSPDEWAARRIQVMTDLAVAKRRLDDAESDLNRLAEAQREGMREMGDMLKEALREVDASCSAKIIGVRQEIAELKEQGRRAVWSRADKLSAAGLGVLIVLSIVGMLVK